MRVTICGGGNSAHVSAGYFASKGFTVNVLTRHPLKWNSTIKVTTDLSSWKAKGTLVGKLNRVSSNPANVVPHAEVILFCSPVNAAPEIASSFAPFLSEGVAIGTVFAQGGFDWIIRDALGNHMSKVVDV